MCKLFIRQKALSLLGAFEVTDASGQRVYTARGISGFTRKMILSTAGGQEVGRVNQKITAWRPKFELFDGSKMIGQIIGSPTNFFGPEITITGLDWKAKGNFVGWNYSVFDSSGTQIARIEKEGFHLTDYYALSYDNEQNAVPLVLLILAIDAMVTTT